MRELAQYALSPFQGLGFVALVSRGSVLRTPPPAYGLVSLSGFQSSIFHLHPPHASGESLVTNFGVRGEW